MGIAHGLLFWPGLGIAWQMTVIPMSTLPDDKFMPRLAAPLAQRATLVKMSTGNQSPIPHGEFLY